MTPAKVDYAKYVAHVARGGKTISEQVDAHNARVTAMIDAQVTDAEAYLKASVQLKAKLANMGVEDFFK